MAADAGMKKGAIIMRYTKYIAACAMCAGLGLQMAGAALRETKISLGPQTVASNQDEYHMGLGASGAIAGNIGAYLLLHPRAKIWVLIMLRIPVRLRAIWIIGFWIAMQILSAVNADDSDQVAWWAHIGGLIAGMALILVMRQRGVPLFAPAPNEPPPHWLHRHTTPAPQAALPVTQPEARGPTGPWG